MEEKLRELLEIAENPQRAITGWKEVTGGKVIGCLPIYVPEEIIHAAGALPVGLWGGTTEIERANAHLQGFSCSIVRGVLEYALKGTYDMVDGFVFPSTCDHVQNSSDIWAKTFPDKVKFDLVYPANRSSNAATLYLADLYREFISWLEELVGSSINNGDLQRSISVYNHHRELMEKLRQLRAEQPQSLTHREMAGLVKASLFMPKEQYNQELEGLLPWLEVRDIKEVPHKRLLLTGIMAEPEELLDVIEDLGCAVVADDLALGSRLHGVQVTTQTEPIDALVQRHLSLGPCSTLFDPGKKRGSHIKELVEKTKANGVVFINMKFCEAEEFDYPILKQELEQAGIPLLFIEVEQQMASFGQIRTRLQAFTEMLA
ncbi:2-hydroxyacyl-CoA dehydratase family protein [Metallumcola ferriviriculae]|uniref:2-hydroxyacyl-CoA dehydratase family protein n=1 Tax=Metallumcola ferriviriculae TaxID=3039180 RepID=A0AAU0URE0_9FIRM|nr:2-hydroxyacyl-CoA dehydratase family protein [Desulfitibacteraceae bacterium MK1]